MTVRVNDRPGLAPDPAEPSASLPSLGSPRPWNAALVLTLVGSFIAAAHRGGRWLQQAGHRMAVNAPPLTGNVDPRISVNAAPAVALALAGIWRADRLAHRLQWRRLLWIAFIVGLAWAAALAFWDGGSGFTRSASSPVDYLRALPAVGDAPAVFLRGFLDGIDVLPSHVRVHPPGFVLALWGLDRAGASGAAWAGALELAIGATTIPAVLMTVREVAGEARARAAAPFLVLAPTAIFWSSGDAVFMGVGAWAVALLVLSTGRESRRSDALATAGGALAALGLFLSYGLVLLGAVPVAVAVSRRRYRPLALALVPVVIAAALLAVQGFWWFDGLILTRREYAESIARVRPYGYFVFANVAALAVALGPAVWVALTRLRDRAVWIVVGPALVAIVIADLSGYTKAEVERIWLPFMPWLIAATGSVWSQARPRRGWLAIQVAWAVAVQMVVFSPW